MGVAPALHAGQICGSIPPFSTQFERLNMIEKDARYFLRRMIKHNGFIADGVYDEHPRLWKSNNAHSSTLMDLGVLGFLRREKLVARDNCGRLVVTERGKRFAKPWYMRLW